MFKYFSAEGMVLNFWLKIGLSKVKQNLLISNLKHQGFLRYYLPNFWKNYIFGNSLQSLKDEKVIDHSRLLFVFESDGAFDFIDLLTANQY